MKINYKKMARDFGVKEDVIKRVMKGDEAEEKESPYWEKRLLDCGKEWEKYSRLIFECPETLDERVISEWLKICTKPEDFERLLKECPRNLHEEVFRLAAPYFKE